MPNHDAIQVRLREPSVVAVSPVPYSGHYQGETRWGHFQFPVIRRLEDRRPAVDYSMHADSSVSCGKENPLCVSPDGGRTWKDADAGERRAWRFAGGIVFPDGNSFARPVTG